jgi:hypothetical protein
MLPYIPSTAMTAFNCNKESERGRGRKGGDEPAAFRTDDASHPFIDGTTAHPLIGSKAVLADGRPLAMMVWIVDSKKVASWDERSEPGEVRLE